MGTLDQEAGILQLQAVGHRKAPSGMEFLPDRHRTGAVDMPAVVAADHILHNLRLVGRDSLLHLAFVPQELRYHHLQTHMLVRHTGVSFGQHWRMGGLHPGMGMICRHNPILGVLQVDHIAHADLVHELDTQVEKQTSWRNVSTPVGVRNRKSSSYPNRALSMPKA